MGKRLTLVLAVAAALLLSLGVAASEVAGRREGYRAGLQDGAQRKEAEMLRSYDDVRQVAVDSLGRELQCEAGGEPVKERIEDPAAGPPRIRTPPTPKD